MTTEQTADDQLLDIAVVGLDCRFPGARDPREYWRLIKDGTVAISRFDRAELTARGVPASVLDHPHHVPAGGIVEGAEEFDFAFFGLSPGEAALIDPQQRMFLECAWRALEDAGHDPAVFPGAIGVLAGQTISTHLPSGLGELLTNPMDVFQRMSSNEKDFLPTRVSHRLGLTGPSINVQTACSTSLVAIHLAAQSLLGHECDMAVAGGVSWTSLRPQGYLHQPGGIMSPDGVCRPFDRDAAGFVPADGIGVVVLRRLGDALASGDRIYAVLKGSAVNNDGAAKVGYTAPGAEGQRRVVSQALSNAGVHPDTVGYVETHGTATRLGDPVEISALTHAYRAMGATGTGTCAIGSVKAAIGHTDVAAGVAGFIKAVLALHHGHLPPAVRPERVNEELGLDGSPFRLSGEGSQWKTGEHPRRAAVSSFGIGGTNAHAVLEEAPHRRSDGTRRRWHLLTLSARDADSLTPLATSAGALLTEAVDSGQDTALADTCHSLAGRQGMRHRTAVVHRDGHTAARSLLDHPRSGGFLAGDAEQDRPEETVFLFPGGGAHHAGMGRGLYADEPLFRDTVDRCLALPWDPDLRRRVREAMYPPQGAGQGAPGAPDALADPAVGLPALLITEVAAGELLAARGVRPTTVLGHSLGEYAAAYFAGVLTLEDALAVVVKRGEILAGIEGGAMLSVAASEESVRPFLTGRLSLSAVNGPRLCVIAGPRREIEAARERLAATGTDSHLLAIATAAHSPLVEAALPEFRSFMGAIPLRPPTLRMISNVTGGAVGDEVTDPEYWVTHLRSTVRFAEGLDSLGDGRLALIEAGPGTALTTIARAHPLAARATITNTLRHPRDPSEDSEVFLRALGRLWVAGAEVDRTGLYAGERRWRMPAARYPFRRDLCRPAGSAPEPRPAVPVSPGPTRPVPALYGAGWRRRVDPPAAAGRVRDRRWLILSDGSPLADELVTVLREHGVNPAVARPGSAFRQAGTSSFVLDPDDRSHCRRLLAALAEPAPGARENTPLRVVDLRPLAPGPAGPGAAGAAGAAGSGTDRSEAAAGEPAGAAAPGLAGLLALAHAAGHTTATALELCLVTRGAFDVTGAERLTPRAACAAGAALALPVELPHVRLRVADLDHAETGTGAGPASLRRAARMLVAETVPAPGTDPVAGYRGGHRWQRRFQRLEPVAGAAPLRAGGVYAITGGLGGVGREVAAHLAAEYGARLVLIGRTAEESDAPDLLVRRGDVRDRERLTAILRETADRFGALHGVIHAAGSPGGGMAQFVDPATLGEALGAKVDGAHALTDALLRTGLTPDFVALFSSLGSLSGSAGLAPYSAANAFLDSYAVLASRELGLPVVALNWDRWEGTGMAREAERAHRELTSHDLGPAMDPADAVRAFVDALGHAHAGQLAVATIHPDDLLDGPGEPPAAPAPVPASTVPVPVSESASVAPPAGAGAGEERHPAARRPGLTTDRLAPRDDREREVLAMWEAALGISGLGVRDNFFELGGHSLMAMRIAQRFNDRFGTAATAQTLFLHPTVEGLTLLLGTGATGTGAPGPDPGGARG
ncbi:SDR family NAD(P)-dependent oxidoreductase [Streptomyces sp. NPDC001889]